MGRSDKVKQVATRAEVRFLQKGSDVQERPLAVVTFRAAPNFLRRCGMQNSFKRALWLWALVVLTTTCVLGQEQELSNLPSYKPAQQQLGVIRIHGSQLSFHLIHLWEDAFLKMHSDIRYRDNILPSWFPGLCAGTEDLSVVGHKAWRPDLMAFEQCFGYQPLEIMFATGGFDENRRGNTPGVVFMVNKENPISKLTLKQLDGIFGAQRSGGWQGTRWTTDSARGANENIRTWGQLGLTGEWKDKPIHLYGSDATQSLWAETIQRVVFKGGDKWNPAIRELVRGDHVRGPSDVQTVTAVANDRYAIGFNFMRLIKENPDVKPLALAGHDEGPYIAPSRETFYNRTYPLVTALYIYLNRPPGKPLAPRLKEFLTYILSREGQQAIADDGMYIPLNPEAAHEQLKKLE
jgi:phosphate transport system substrate-binding protein